MKSRLIVLAALYAVATTAVAHQDVPGMNPPHAQGLDVPGMNPPHAQGLDVPGMNPPHVQGLDVPRFAAKP